MTKCRRLFFKRLFVDRDPLHVACHKAGVSTKTGYRWFHFHRLTGKVAAPRVRKWIPGVVLQRDQDILFVLVKNYPLLHHDELAEKLFEETGHAYSHRQIRQVMKRASFVYKLVNHQAPIERDLEFRRFWREQVIFPGGLLRAEHLLYVDETNKRNSDCARTRAFCVKGQSVEVPVRATNLGLSASVIASISIEGIQSCVGIDIARDGNVNGDKFLEIFKRDILPLCQQWPGKRSVVVLDNAAVHMKYLIDAECSAKGVIALYLPPYSFDYNPIELVFNIAKMKLQRDHGHGIRPINIKMHDVFAECISTCITPDNACNLFEHCFIPVTVAERAWANRCG
jgi:transposase